MAESPKDITISISGVIFASLFETMLPFVLAFFWIKKFNGKTSHILIGVGGFISSVLIESVFLFLISAIFGKETFMFYLFAGISPGLFEETGKYLFIKYIFSKDKQKNNAVSYGIGHGGIESFGIGIALIIQMCLKDTLIEKGSIKESITFSIFVMSALERLSAVTLHISLSVINYKAIREPNINYYILAIILHDLVDSVAFLKLKGILTSVYIIELIVGLFSLGLALYSYNLYINFKEKEEEKREKIIPLEEKKENTEILDNY